MWADQIRQISLAARRQNTNTPLGSKILHQARNYPHPECGEQVIVALGS